MFLRQLSLPAGGLGLVALFAAGIYSLIYREFGLPVRILLALGVVLIAFFLWYNTEPVGAALRGREVRYGSNALAMTLAFLGIVALLNFLGVRYSQRWDLTQAQRYSLSPQTLKVVRDLRDNIQVTGFFLPEDAPRKQQAEDLLKEYRARSDKISYEFVDPDLHPAEAQKFNIRQSGTLVFQRSERRQEVLTVGESDFTSALVKLTTEPKKVYFLTGHSERAIDSYDRDGYAQVRRELERENLKVEALNLVARRTVPEDAGVLIIAAPKSPLLPEEKQAINDYLDAGGKALVAAEPRTGYLLNDILQRWGIEAGEGVVVDPERSFFGDLSTPVITKYAYSLITKDMEGVITVFPFAAPVRPAATYIQGLSLLGLAETSDKSWIETDAQRASYDEGTDPKGPTFLAATAEAQPLPPARAQPPAGQEEARGDQKPRTRLVVFGDADFASNAFLGLLGNRDFFVNSVNWLAQAEELISIRPKAPEDRPVMLTPSQFNLVFLTSAGLLPLIVLAAGALVWWARR